MEHKISIDLQEDHPAYQWAKKQSDSVNALGHIGTHIDCYSASPTQSAFELDVVLLNCIEEMPSMSDIANQNFEGKAVVLFTGVLNTYGYGTKEYGEAKTFLSENVLDAILAMDPKFIVIDACGIGNHGEEHIRFDKKCEAEGCFVIENVCLDDSIAASITKLRITLDTNNPSTGKPCEVHVICKR